jgi:hypothetical protein
MAIVSCLLIRLQLQDGAKNARGDDVSKLMNRVAEWLNQQYPHEPPLSAIKRDNRGIHHPITGMLLCPIRYNWDHEEWVLPSVLLVCAHY